MHSWPLRRLPHLRQDHPRLLKGSPLCPTLPLPSQRLELQQAFYINTLQCHRQIYH